MILPGTGTCFPAKAGIQGSAGTLRRSAWAPASAGELICDPIEPPENLQAEAVVEEVALADQLAVLVNLLDIALHRAREERVGEPLPGDAQRRVPGGGEDRIAAARGVGAGNAHARGVTGFGDDGRLGERFAEGGHLLAGPAVVAHSHQSGTLMGTRIVGGEGGPFD